MSYSRWGSSRFYTFWGGHNDVKEDQLFCIMLSLGKEIHFTYSELKLNIENCLDRTAELAAKAVEWKMRTQIIPPSEETTDEIDESDPFLDGDREELTEYMIEFINDMDEYFKITQP